MNIHNLVSAALAYAGLDESDYLVRVRYETTLYVSIHMKEQNKSIHMMIGLGEDNAVTDFVVSDETLSYVIGYDAYEYFIDRMSEETYIYV